MALIKPQHLKKLEGITIEKGDRQQWTKYPLNLKKKKIIMRKQIKNSIFFFRIWRLKCF